jgi:hypothetical protein
VRFAAMQPPVRPEFDHHGRNLEQCIRGAVEATGFNVDDHRQKLAEAAAHERRAGE